MLTTAGGGGISNFELGERPVGRFVEVREGQPMSFVRPKAFYPPEHPLVVLVLLRL